MPTAEVRAPQSHPFQPQPWRDRRMVIVLGNLLRTGVMISAAVVLWGACIYLYRHGHEAADYRIFRGEPSDYRTIPGVIQSAMGGHGRGWIQLGLLLLISTPIA